MLPPDPNALGSGGVNPPLEDEGLKALPLAHTITPDILRRLKF